MTKKIMKSLAIAGVASLLAAGSAMALPTTNNDGIDTTVLAAMFSGAGSTIDAADDDTNAEMFQFQTSGATATYVATLSGATPVTSFGLYDAKNTSNQLTLFDGSSNLGDATQIYIDVVGTLVTSYIFGLPSNTIIDTADFADNLFGFYVNNGTNTYFSGVNDNGGQDNFLTYQGNGDQVTLPGLPVNGASDFGHWYVAANASSTADGVIDNFMDIVVQVESMQPAPVPEPATMLLLGTGLVGLAGARRRKKAQK